MRNKDYKELDLTSNFIFAKVMTNPDKRSRYYQGLIDLNLIAKGENYEKLNKSFVIFICMSDIFGKGRHIYTFENRCIQDTDITLEDGTTKIFLNPYSEMDDISPELANFLKFLTDGKPVDKFTERLVEAVETARNNKMWELEYKAFCANRQDAYREGKGDGLAEGLESGLFALVRTLKPILPDFDQVFNAVIRNKEYEDTPREEVMKYYQMCPPTHSITLLFTLSK